MKKPFTIFLNRTKTNEKIRITLNDNDQPFIIGRSSECDCTISGNPMISRQHIEITIKDNNIYIGDLGSKFLTFLDDKQVTEPVKIYDSQILKLADELFTIEMSEVENTKHIEAINEGSHCPICHSLINESDKFCTVCGSFIG